MRTDRSWGLVRDWRRITLLLATIVLIAGQAGTATAQDSKDETDIEIVVHPSSAEPAGPTRPGEQGGLDGSDGANSSGNQGDAPADQTVKLLGTVSAQFVVMTVTPVDDEHRTATVSLVVRDDRGNALGWTLTLQHLLNGGGTAQPALMVNHDGTIVRVMPDDGRLSEQIDDVHGGRTIGPLSRAIPLLIATPGSGSGVFLQRLEFVNHGHQEAEIVSSFLIQIPFAP